MKPNYPLHLKIYVHAIQTIKSKIKSLQKLERNDKMDIDLIELYDQLAYINYKLKEWRESQ